MVTLNVVGVCVKRIGKEATIPVDQFPDSRLSFAGMTKWASSRCRSERIKRKRYEGSVDPFLSGVLNALAVEKRLQLALVEHLADDVAAADELARHIELRDGRPIGELFDAVA